MKNVFLKISCTLSLVLGLATFSQAQVRQQQKLDPVPSAPKVATPEDTGLLQQAGVGGNTGYARAGVMELGGSAGANFADDFIDANISPFVGWFVVDNVQLSAILNWNYINQDKNAAHALSLLVEPSFHIPTSDTHFLFAGMGIGLQYLSEPEGETGFAIAPRVGTKMLVGRSGMFTVDVRPIFTFNDTVQTNRGTVLGVESLWSVNAGYSILW